MAVDQDAFTARGCTFFVDVRPLFDANWTGIPVVAANICRELLKLYPDNVEFIFDSTRASKAAVTSALKRNNGTLLSDSFFQGVADLGGVRAFSNGPTIGIFPSVKTVRGLFDIECSIVHDMSTLLTPQYHTDETTEMHAHTIVRDIVTNDLTVCVSEATKDDVVAYLGQPASGLEVIHNGVHWPEAFEVRAANEFDVDETEPYFLVLGTREPRKNIQRVLDLVSTYPDVLDDYRLVITGKTGWLQESEASNILGDVAPDRIVLTGYVTEYQKYKLLRGARATIYPSFFEGFGLPILESLSVGTPCIASLTSSIPEVGGDACFYFDPLSTEDLRRAIAEFEALDAQGRQDLGRRCFEQADRFRWDGMTLRLLELLQPVVTRRFPVKTGPGG